jgi:hypothetical protein
MTHLIDSAHQWVGTPQMSDQNGAPSANSSNKITLSGKLLLGLVFVLTVAWGGILIWLAILLFKWLFG